MKLLTHYITRVLLSAIVLSITVYSCKKSDPNENLEAPRLFKPGGVSVKTSETAANITWSAPLLSSNLKVSYQVDFSQDSTFASTEFTLRSDTLGVTATDEKLSVRKIYFARVKALTTGEQPESKYIRSRAFLITGEQLFLPVRELEIKETQLTLRWKPTTGLDKIIVAQVGGTGTAFTISASEAATGVKIISGLTAGAEYYSEIFMGTKSKGFLNVKTLAATTYSVILNSGADLVAAINNAANNAVIGLNPGTYSAGSTNFVLLQKTVTLKSTSGNPLDTKVNFREFTLRGTGAGIILNGIEFDGTPSGSLYFILPTGVSGDAEQANFTQVNINNCIVHGVTTSFMRANRGAAAGDYKMEKIEVRNSLVYDIGSTLQYIFFHLDKLQFGSLNVSKSTFYNFGRALVSCSTVINAPVPTISLDFCTFNNVGSNGGYVLMDANANPVKFSMTNSIIANVPRPGGSVNAVVLRANGAGSAIVFNNNNTFNYTNGTGTILTLPTANVTQSANQTVNLGWSLTTTDFTLPAVTPLRSASNTGNPIGDPRWTY